jgi:hypothetical protein
MADKTTFKLIERIDYTSVPSAMAIIESHLVVGLTEVHQDDQVLPQTGSIIKYLFDGA